MSRLALPRPNFWRYERDYVTRDMLVRQLEDTEQDHAHWLEKQLRLIELMGLQNYLQSQSAEPNMVGATH